MLNHQRLIRALIGRVVRWRELLFWTFLLAAFQSLESSDDRRQIMGMVETVAFLVVAVRSAGKLDGLGLEFTNWNPIDFTAARVSVGAGFLAGGAVVAVALRCHQPLGADRSWSRVVLAVVLGPVVEEMVFRGYLMTAALRLARAVVDAQTELDRHPRTGANLHACSRMATGHHVHPTLLHGRHRYSLWVYSPSAAVNRGGCACS